MANSMFDSLVADSAAFLKNAQLQNIANRIFTVQDVVHEIRDAATRQRLAVLPYEIEFREPSTESVKTISEFAKKTGDFPSLSAVDIKVMALTYQLEKEFCSKEHIREEPVNKIERKRGGGITTIKPEHGFYFDNKSHIGKDSQKENSIEKNDENTDKVDDEGEMCESSELVGSQEAVVNKNNDEDISIDKVMDVEVEIVNEDDLQSSDNIASENVGDNTGGNVINSNEDGNKSDDESDDDGGDDEGWITPGNISKVKKEMGFDDVDQSPVNAKSGCLTTDFAMQNVLMQMGLHVISVDGMLIRQARSYILKCHGCGKETTQMERVFCKNCGNKTLKKVSVSVNLDGSLTYHYPKRMRPQNIRGTKYAIPLPKAGRHASNAILTEDQKMSTQRLPKSNEKANPLCDDYVARTSPFTYKDVTSKAFSKGFHLKENTRKNPNEGRKTKSKRK
ncbi:RNA-binding protein NOB1-like [Rhopilema esculentum]|uniref:RNA-binding protein NOB1-like n=1 Tax=Rhopilema esculentum TaxID=499914 RepID=UPI0031D489C8